jgi:plasmid stability protein
MLSQKLHNAVMTAITIRDVPDDVKAELADEAAAAGQSLQAYLLAILTEQAKTADHNRELLRETERWFAEHGGGLGPEGPDPAEVIREERRKAGRE